MVDRPRNRVLADGRDLELVAYFAASDEYLSRATTRFR
jgi:hypothetical protein